MNSTFLETSISQTGNPSFTSPFLYSYMTQDCGYNFQDCDFNNCQDFESSSFLDQLLVDYSPTNNNFNTSLSENPILQESSTNINHLREKSKGGIKKEKMNERHINAVVFRTKTQLEILDDGYKWRKYGKKKVKSNTNLRNYYKCSSGGCKVKKRIERDGHDSSYLITTYEGRHNHESFSIIYNNEIPLSFLNEWTLQAIPNGV
ncbi:putative WRKY transcription factor 51 [Nicotiana tabacum]|uniref:WRKY transcription factor 51 n=2 Tax=Nicotiana TaxID=4085 RepID=A0A1S4B088_TOBAC|nr:PREDICTED: probable WRKY transcription factor 51 [Nicotiana sylvestris]XP_016482352.1 PREDICTED: probable WRKY transcription factor 51 [Nicotiana tabacum]